MNNTIALHCLGFRVVACIDGQYLVDEFELSQAAIECAQRVHAAGHVVVSCDALEQDGFGDSHPKPLRWREVA